MNTAPNYRVLTGLALALILWAHGSCTLAQLAITEVMSNPSTTGLTNGFLRADFWELTNFGTNEVDLNGYRWCDAEPLAWEARPEIEATTIKPGESVIFVKATGVIHDSATFRAWWGLPTNLQIYVHLRSPGLDGENEDAVRLWNADGRLVDEVRFGSAREGFSITYDQETGAFNRLCSPEIDGAFSSAEGTDIGSPGKALLKLVPVKITQQPVDQAVDAGSDLVVRVQATGRPAPTFQWYFNAFPMEAPVITSSVPRLVWYANCGPSWERPPGPNDLTIPSIRPDKSGDYFVKVFNGFSSKTSSVMHVTVNTNPSPIQVICPEVSCEPGIGLEPATFVANPGQTAIFTVKTLGYPVPTFQWSSSVDGSTYTDLPGETDRKLTIAIADVTSSHDSYYRVRMENTLGTVDSEVVRLCVEPPPRLAITEVMALACTTAVRDWWELTNIGEKPVDLCGYRWDDGTQTIGGGPTITNNVILQPGESAIFLESQTAESFVRWWGATNLPPNLKFVTYGANGLSEDGESIRLWPPNETNDLRWIAIAEFSTAPAGVSQWWDLERCTNVIDEDGFVVGEFGSPSVVGQCNAFQAEEDCEIASPGWTRWTPPVLTSVVREGSVCKLSWKAQAGSINRLQFARQLAFPPEATFWEKLDDYQFTGFNGAAVDNSLGSDTQRFYRILQVSDSTADCPCPELVE